ncbi:MAG: hypothetical protein OEY59_05010 [Deltaproteobacteria bacterium]|nr:hypothetical protein [Deltaproteobacteria bacterium]
MTKHVCLKEALIRIIGNEKKMVAFTKKYAFHFKSDEKAHRLLMDAATCEKTKNMHLTRLLMNLSADRCNFLIEDDGKYLVSIMPREMAGSGDGEELNLMETIRTLELWEEKESKALNSINRNFGPLDLGPIFKENEEIINKIYAYKLTGPGYQDQYIASGNGP